MTREWHRLLEFAAARGHKDLVALALNQGVPVDASFDDGKNALYYAAVSGRLETLQLLLMRGARVGALQAFVAASAEGHSAVVRELRMLAAAEMEKSRGAAQELAAQQYATPSPPSASGLIVAPVNTSADPENIETQADSSQFTFAKALPGPA